MSSGDEEFSTDHGSALEVEEPTTVRRKERGIAKGVLTRLINGIEKIPKTKENLQKIKEKLNLLPETVQRFEAAHQHYVTTLKDHNAVGEPA